MPSSPRRVALALVAALVLPIAACSSALAVVPTPVGPTPETSTAPGTALAIGETAWIPHDAPGGEAELVGTTVRALTPLDPAEVTGFEDDPRLAAATPYALLVQYDWPAENDFATIPREIPVLPITDDGAIARWLTDELGNVVQGDTAACGVDIPDPDAGTALSCVIGLSADGPIVGAIYNGTGLDDLVLDDTHPYAQAPVTWRE